MTTTSSPVTSKLRSPPLSWIVWAASMTVVAVTWVFKRGHRQPEKVLTRAEEKQRRKALVREHRRRK